MSPACGCSASGPEPHLRHQPHLPLSGATGTASSEAIDLLRVMEAGTGVQLGSLWAQSFPTPRRGGGVGYILSGEESRIVLATDLGYITRR